MMMDKPDKKFELLREIVSKEDNVKIIQRLMRKYGLHCLPAASQSLPQEGNGDLHKHGGGQSAQPGI